MQLLIAETALKYQKKQMIRKHEERDLEDIIDIWHQSSTLAHPFLEPAFVEKVLKDMREIYIPNSETWVFEKDGVVIGFIGMQGNEIGGLFVRPNFHSQGVGTELVNFISQLYKELEVEVFKKNKIGRAFYEKYGFKIIYETIHEETKNELLTMKFNR